MNKEQLIEELMKQSDKIFFYCVKRCNSRVDAEDLSQDILLDIIININKGIEIENFDYYIWQICKNHYSKYINSKVKERDSIIYEEDINQPADNINILDELVENEKIAMINASIKLLSRNYQEILYSYYIEDNTMSYISKKLNLPLGTVQRRLFDIRNKLKEYLKMERLNGKKAYVPKDFVGVISCDEKPNCNPHEITKPLLVKNILFHSYNNPCSMEDYSIELGISRPYIEDYINDLICNDLLEKKGDKYLTKIAFINKETRRKILDYVRNNISNLSNTIIDFCSSKLAYYRSLLDNRDIPDELLMWTLIFLTILGMENSKQEQYTKRKDGSRWDFCLMETVNLIYEDEFFISCNGFESPVASCSLKGLAFPAATMENKNNVAKTLFTKNAANGMDINLELFDKLIKNKTKYSDLSLIDKKSVDKYIEKNYIKIDDDVVDISIPVISNKSYEELLRILISDKMVSMEYEKLKNKIYKDVKELIPQNIANLTNFIISTISNTIRSLILSKAYLRGVIKEDNKEYFAYNMILIK